MELTNYRYLKSMRLPSDWQELPSEDSSIGYRTLRAFSPSAAPQVRMEFFYRGLPLDDVSSHAFRDVLKTAPKLIFDGNAPNKPSESDVNLIERLRELLGNAGNNQLVNKRDDYLGPSFIVERLEALPWNGRNLLALRGWFRDCEEDTRVYDFCGFFIDGNPSEPQCQVEEIFLEAADEQEYIRYLPIFQQSLKSIEWM